MGEYIFGIAFMAVIIGLAFVFGRKRTAQQRARDERRRYDTEMADGPDSDGDYGDHDYDDDADDDDFDDDRATGSDVPRLNIGRRTCRARS